MDGLAVDLVCPAGEVAEVVDGQRDVRSAAEDRLARYPGGCGRAGFNCQLKSHIV